jgi:ABC-type Fe3+ transport system permease subunit
LIAIGSILLTIWLLLVPLGALLMTAFSEDTIYGPGDLTLENFKDAYSSSRILLLIWNSFVFAAGGSALTILMGGLVAWLSARICPGAISSMASRSSPLLCLAC